MTELGSLVHVGLTGSRRLLPWISILLVSAALTYAMNGALTGSWEIPYERPTVSIAPAAGDLSAPETFAAGDDARAGSRSCVTIFGSYNWWLFSSGRHGPCRMEPDASPESPPDR
jgi:hypothetical protein